MKNYRHGDLCLIGIKELPQDLKPSKTKILMVGSGGNNHSINKGTVYIKNVDEFVFGYLEAKDTKLLHIEHGKKVKGKELREAKIEDGIYELRKQMENTHSGMKQVID
jgi:hypothetical protein